MLCDKEDKKSLWYHLLTLKWKTSPGSPLDSHFPRVQNAMPLSSAIFKSEHKNPVPQCPPRLDVQTINAVLWSRMPNTFLKVETARVSERHGWVVQCVEPLQMLAVHIPEENRCGGCSQQWR